MAENDFSMVKPSARRAWLASSLGMLILVSGIVAAVFGWVVVQRSLGKGPLHRSDPQTVGTAGTGDELKFRGANETRIARLDDVAAGTR